MDRPVDARLLSELQRYLPDFNRAYDVDGMRPEEFDHYGAARKTLSQFLNGYDSMVGIIRRLL
jgi:transaldolase